MSKKRKDKLEIKAITTTWGQKPRWFWHLRSAYNGEIMCSGQPIGYSRKANAIKGWESVAGSARAGVEIVGD